MEMTSDRIETDLIEIETTIARLRAAQANLSQRTGDKSARRARAAAAT